MKARQLVITAAFLAMTGTAMAQSTAAPNAPPTGGTVNGATSPDPFVQKRQSDADAKAEYKAKNKAANQQRRADKKAAKKELKQQKREATAERNAELAKQPPGTTDKAP